ncbi:unnamed protein product, partial [Urochloa humidicola]
DTSGSDSPESSRTRGGAGSARDDEAATRHHPDGDPLPYDINTLHRLVTGLEHSHFHGVDGLCWFTYCKL